MHKEKNSSLSIRTEVYTFGIGFLALKGVLAFANKIQFIVFVESQYFVQKSVVTKFVVKKFAIKIIDMQ